MDLMRYIPWKTYHGEQHVADYQHAVGEELAALLAARDDYYDQMRIATATWGLSLFDREYGIQPDEGKDPEKRRLVLRAKKRGRGTTTSEVLRQLAEMMTGLPAEVVEYPEQDYFEIWIESVGQPADTRDLAEQVEVIKPAHLGVGYGWRSTTEATVHVAALSHTRASRRGAHSPPGKQAAHTRVYTAHLSHSYACHREGGRANT